MAPRNLKNIYTTNVELHIT